MDFSSLAGHFIVGVVGRALNYLALRYGLLVLVSGHRYTSTVVSKSFIPKSWCMFGKCGIGVKSLR
jgi:hypothetical protein